jgi:hypothetical protein
MRPHRAIFFLLVFPAVLLVQAKDKKQPVVPAIFGQARYVYVEAVDGQEFDPNLYREDREAIADVRDALQDWNRYFLTAERQQADLVIVVRKGRAVSANVAVIPGGRPGPGVGGGQSPGQQRDGMPMGGPATEIGTEAGPPDDFFEVLQMNPDGGLSSPLWERSMPDGLDAPRVLLLRQFRDAVEKAYPNKPAAQSTSQPANQPTNKPTSQPGSPQKP